MDNLILQRLYDLGARKFVVMSLYPNGCSPMVRARIPIPMPTDCVQAINVPLRLYNNNLRSLVDEMTQKMPGSKLVYVNVYKIIRDIIRTPTQHGKYFQFFPFLFLFSGYSFCGTYMGLSYHFRVSLIGRINENNSETAGLM